MNQKIYIKLGELNDRWFAKLEADKLTSLELRKCRADFARFGEYLDKIGGFGLMSECILLFPKWQRRFVELAWHNIGGWRA